MSSGERCWVYDMDLVYNRLVSQKWLAAREYFSLSIYVGD